MRDKDSPLRVNPSKPFPSSWKVEGGFLCHHGYGRRDRGRAISLMYLSDQAWFLRSISEIKVDVCHWSILLDPAAGFPIMTRIVFHLQNALDIDQVL
jgi:hypothetical protein